MHPPNTGREHPRWWVDTVNLMIVLTTAVLGISLALVIWHWSWTYSALIVPYAWLAFTVISAQFYRSHQAKLPSPVERVIVIMAVGSDINLLDFRMALDSLDVQSNMWDALYVIGNNGDCAAARRTFEKWQDERGNDAWKSPARFLSREQFTKRDAQLSAYFATFNDATVGPTPDSTAVVVTDGNIVLDRWAIGNGIKPLADPRVASVTGMLYAGRNHLRNWRTRAFALAFEAGMEDRAAQSAYRAVLCSRGLAIYRGSVFERHYAAYADQSVRGKHVVAGDDRALTEKAARDGWTVFEESCVGRVPVAETVAYASRRQARWWRTLWLGSLEIRRHHSPRKPIWWLNAFQMLAFALQAVVATPLLLVVEPFRTGGMSLVVLLAYSAAASCIKAMRTLAVKRPGQSLAMQIASFIPASLLHAALDLWFTTPLMVGGAATAPNTTWELAPHTPVSAGRS